MWTAEGAGGTAEGTGAVARIAGVKETLEDGEFLVAA
jgi:hypothetical protein